MRGTDHLGPFLGFIGEELAEFSRCQRKRRAAQIGKARRDFGISEGRSDLAIELIDNGGGLFLGAPSPSQSPASKPGTNSLTVGTSGSAGERAAVVTASARSFPLLTCSIDPATPAKEIRTCPPRRSANAGPAPRYGT